MAFAVALPKNVKLAPDEVAVTMVVPAPSGCNLNCPFCFIRARKEALPSQIVLGSADYLDFVEAMVARKKVALVSIQGYEPLLPEIWNTSKAILQKSLRLGVRSALVTNGTFLAERVDELVALGIGGITVSLDSDRAEWHDQTRRTRGAFARTHAGLVRAAAGELRERIVVASVLQPGRTSYLENVPHLLAKLGLRYWVVTPVYRIGDDTDRATAEPPEKVVRELTGLYSIAMENGISMLVDDEFDTLIRTAGPAVDLAQLRLRRLSRLNQVVRLSPDGACAIGSKILDRSAASSFVWNPRQEPADDFAARIAVAI